MNKLAPALIGSSLLAHTAVAQIHEGDIALGIDNNKLAVGDGARLTDGSFDFSESVFGVFLGALARTTDPGFDTDQGTFAPGTQVGYEYTAALRKWDGEDFDQIPPERVRMSLGPNPGVSTPTTDEVVRGISAGANSFGEYHTHYAIRLELDGSPATGLESDGVYLLTLRLYEETGSIETSDDFWLVLDNFASQSEFDAAINFVRDTIAAGPVCLADANADGLLNGADFNSWLAAFAVSDPIGDQNQDGLFNGADFNSWLANFAAGCD